MDKSQLWEALLRHLEEELNATTAASKDAADYATNEESRAESKWDTQGLEASYLAAGQATHARELVAALQQVRGDKANLTAAHRTAEIGALVCCELNGFRDWYFLVRSQGGIEITAGDGTPVTTLTLGTPLGAQLRGKSAGSAVLFPNGSKGRIVEIL
jgi:hypothetical protein